MKDSNLEFASLGTEYLEMLDSDDGKAALGGSGSGTTRLALKHGCATLIIPHIIDQFVWNSIIDEMGVGPKGIRIDKVTTKNLEAKILELVNNASFKKKAEHVAGRMEKEDFKEGLYNAIVA